MAFDTNEEDEQRREENFNNSNWQDAWLESDSIKHRREEEIVNIDNKVDKR